VSLTERQLAIRKTGITATDVRVLSGLDPYGRTPHDVWRSKVLGEEDFEETEAIELGMALEPIVIPRLAKKVGYHVLRLDPEKLTMCHPRVAHHIATPDALLARSAFHDPEATAQIKVCGLHTAGAWGRVDEGADAVPDHVLVQVAWEQYVAMQPVSFVGALIGTEVRAYRVELTSDVAELVEVLRDVADRFWSDHVLTKRPPSIDGSEGSARMLKSMFPRAKGPMVRASEDAESAAAMYFAATVEVAAAKQRKETAQQLLIAACGEAEGIAGNGWRLRYAMRKPYHVDAHDVAEGRRFDLRTTGAKARAKKEEAA
jgi:predicted phage-related endonuclease